MLNVQLRREMDAVSLNAILNHPEVGPDIGLGAGAAPADFSAIVANHNNLNLVGQFGAMLCIEIRPGIYELHVGTVKEGRGRWAVAMARAALHHLFTRTGAMEAMVRCPLDRPAVKWMARQMGGKYEFTAPTSGLAQELATPADVYSLTLQEWARHQDEALRQRGRWMMLRLVEELRSLGKDAAYASPDPSSGLERTWGLVFDLICGGQFGKALMVYDRWAHYSGSPALTIISEKPTTINYGGILVIVRENDLWVPYVEAPHLTEQ